jgi:hypothetical protein
MVWLPLLAAGTTVGGMIAGGSQAAAQLKEAQRREKYNQMMDAINTKFSVFGGGPSHRLQETSYGPGAGTGALLGGLGGLQSGLNLYSGLKDMGLGSKMGDGSLKVNYQGNTFGKMSPSFQSDMSWLDPSVMNAYGKIGG